MAPPVDGGGPAAVQLHERDALHPPTRARPSSSVVAVAGTRPERPASSEAGDFWRCQATEAFRASEPLKTSNLAQYWREFRNGNFGPLRFVFLAARGFVMEVADRLGKLKPLPLEGPGTDTGPAGLDLQPGELVRVRRPDEIAATLDETGHNRRLSFDREMLPYCGKTLAVKYRVDRIIEDKTGRMLKIPKDCLVLEGAVCSGNRSAAAGSAPERSTRSGARAG